MNHFDELRFAGSNTIHGVHMLLEECDGDFSPRLSTRHDNLHYDFNDGNGSMMEYLYSLMKWSVNIVFIDGNIAAVCFYEDREDYTYLSLIVVGHDYRGMKLASKLYASIEDNAVNNTVRLRTSSRNESQLAVLAKRGYELVETLKDDRGEGVDTLKFEKVIGRK